MNDYFETTLNVIEESLHKIDVDVFETLIVDSVDILKSGHKIVVSGLGKNVPICEKFVGTMISLGLNATFIHTNTALHGDLGAICPGDLVIVLSKSGETVESLYLLNELKKRDILLWSITFNEKSTLSKETPHTLSISMKHEGDKWNIVPNNSTTIYLILLQTLAMQCSERLGVTLDDFKMNHPGGHIGVQLNEKQ